MNSITENMLGSMRATKPWTRFLSILGFISVAFTLFMAGSMILGFGPVQQQMQGEQAMSAFMFMVMGGMYILMAILYFFPSLFLFKYASSIGRLLDSGGSEEMETALQHQKSFWRFAGIFSLVFVIIGLLGIVAAIAIPAYMAYTGSVPQ